MSKRIIAFLLMLVIAASSFPLGIFAVESSESESATALIYVESTYCVIGKTVEVNICISNNPGIAGAKFSVSFDEGLTLIAASEDGGVFEALDYTAPSAFENLCPFNWDSLDAVTSENGRILTLTFEVADTVMAGDQLDINVSYSYGDIYDADLNSVAVTMMSGTLDVIDYQPGDVDGDGTVNGKDVTLIRRYNANWDVEINLLAADVNADGVVNGKDVTQVRRFNADWDVELEPGLVVCEHNLAAVAETKETCTEAGNIAYWQCSLCDVCFFDAEAKTEISLLETVVAATGHTEVVDQAVAPTYSSTGLTEGVHCSVCGTVLTAQKVVPILTPDYYSITYSNLQGATSPTLTQYASHIGVLEEEMPEPERAGYQFEGWYTADGTQISCIPAGSEQNYELLARWSLIEYTITYYCGQGVNSPNNILIYDVNTSFTFVAPTLEGCDFYRWVDQNGDTVTKIEKGSTGDLVLTAEYAEKRYTTVSVSEIKNPKYKSEIAFAEYDETHNLYRYVYYLGYVADVPLTQQSGIYYNGIPSITQGYQKVTATSESTETAFATVTSLTISTEISSSINAKEEVGIEFAKASVEASIAASMGTEGTTSHEESITKAITHSAETVESFEFEIHAGSPHGYYRVAYMGMLDMFVAVVYDPMNDNIEIVKYSILRDEAQFSIDYSLSPEFDGHRVEEFDFVIPEEVEDHILYLSTGSDGIYPQINEDTCSAEVYTGTDTDVVIPTYLNGKKVTSFAAGMFAGNTEITSVTFGEGITSIPESAFEGCTSLVSVTFNGKLVDIGANAFKDCAALEFEIPGSVTSIGDSAFDGCKAMDNVKISNADISLGTTIFNNCGDLSLTVNSGDLTLVQTAISSGATNVYIDWISSETAMNANCTLTVPTIQAFELNGNLQAFNNLDIVSDATNTTIKYVAINNTTGENALAFSSTNVHLRALSVTSNKTALALTADSANLSIGEKVTLKAQNGCDGMSANNVSISAVVGEVVTFNVTGGDGNPGGAGINATGTLTISGYITLNVLGGTGSKGYDGNCADDDGDNGESGGTGSNGGVGVSADAINVDSGIINIIGGTGGQGGNGGCCNPNWKVDGKESGGNGGTGGTGGLGVSANTIIVASGTANITGGTGGKGGDRGGIYVGSDGFGIGYGDYGSYGSGGNGGAAVNDTCVIEGEQNLGTFSSGENGATGTGEDCRDH